jgi:hypothetical protein
VRSSRIARSDEARAVSFSERIGWVAEGLKNGKNGICRLNHFCLISKLKQLHKPKHDQQGHKAANHNQG